MEKIILRGKKLPKTTTILDDVNEALEPWEWQYFWDEVGNFDKQDKADEYIIHPYYAGYIGKGGTFIPVVKYSLRSAISACLECADYGCKIEETKGGLLVITTYDHDGTNTFKIYKKQNGRRCNLRYTNIVWVWG